MGWSGISVPNSGGAVTSDMVIDKTGTAHIVWTDGTKSFYAKYLPPSKPTLIEQVDRDTDTIDLKTGTAESQGPAVALRSNGDVIFAYSVDLNGTGKRSFYKVKHGAVWSSPIKIGDGWDIDVALDSLDNLHFVWGAGGNLTYTKFNAKNLFAGTKTLSSSGVAHGGSIGCKGGQIWVAWEERRPNAPAEIVAEMSQGGAWGRPIVLSVADGNPAINVASYVDPSHVSFVWQQGNKVILWQDDIAKPITDGQVSNPSISYLMGTPIVAYSKRTMLGQRQLRVWFNGVIETVDVGLFATVRSFGTLAYVIYRHSPTLPIELRFREKVF